MVLLPTPATSEAARWRSACARRFCSAVSPIPWQVQPPCCCSAGRHPRPVHDSGSPQRLRPSGRTRQGTVARVCLRVPPPSLVRGEGVGWQWKACGRRGATSASVLTTKQSSVPQSVAALLTRAAAVPRWQWHLSGRCRRCQLRCQCQGGEVVNAGTDPLQHPDGDGDCYCRDSMEETRKSDAAKHASSLRDSGNSGRSDSYSVSDSVLDSAAPSVFSSWPSESKSSPLGTTSKDEQQQQQPDELTVKQQEELFQQLLTSIATVPPDVNLRLFDRRARCFMAENPIAGDVISENCIADNCVTKGDDIRSNSATPPVGAAVEGYRGLFLEGSWNATRSFPSSQAVCDEGRKPSLVSRATNGTTDEVCDDDSMLTSSLPASAGALLRSGMPILTVPLAHSLAVPIDGGRCVSSCEGGTTSGRRWERGEGGEPGTGREESAPPTVRLAALLLRTRMSSCEGTGSNPESQGSGEGVRDGGASAAVGDGMRSVWQSYWTLLPQHVDSLVDWTNDELRQLHVPHALAFVDRHRVEHGRMESHVQQLTGASPALARWALRMVLSRSFGVSIPPPSASLSPFVSSDGQSLSVPSTPSQPPDAPSPASTSPVTVAPLPTLSPPAASHFSSSLPSSQGNMAVSAYSRSVPEDSPRATEERFQVLVPLIDMANHAPACADGGVDRDAADGGAACAAASASWKVVRNLSSIPGAAPHHTHTHTISAEDSEATLLKCDVAAAALTSPMLCTLSQYSLQLAVSAPSVLSERAFRRRRGLCEGDEVTISYGPHCSLTFLLNFGFIPQNNPSAKAMVYPSVYALMDDVDCRVAQLQRKEEALQCLVKAEEPLYLFAGSASAPSPTSSHRLLMDCLLLLHARNADEVDSLTEEWQRNRSLAFARIHTATRITAASQLLRRCEDLLAQFPGSQEDDKKLLQSLSTCGRFALNSKAEAEAAAALTRDKVHEAYESSQSSSSSSEWEEAQARSSSDAVGQRRLEAAVVYRLEQRLLLLECVERCRLFVQVSSQ